ncbi:hypothetical protein [Rossellomorea marisflavi]|nr:hypothetical protein [Rossellomorea marisflavi]
MTNRIELFTDIIAKESLIKCNGKQTVVPNDVAEEIGRLQKLEKVS